MMKLTVKEAYALHESMATHIQSGRTIKGKVGLAFAYNFRILHEALGEYITRRDTIVKKYADPVDEETHKKNEKAGIADPIVISNRENLEKANEEIKEFEDLTIELPLMEITNEDIMNTEGIDSSDMSILIFMSSDYIKAIKDIKKKK